MELDYELILSRLLLALLAGGLIGIERAIHGRQAGFRTHSLVCVSSSLLMVLMVYQWDLVPKAFLDTVRADPSRMAQGIMTGIGFLGAGVIIKEGLTVRGLTTAASIWMTAAIGIVIGLGFYFPAMVTTLITILTLSAFRWLESLLPTQSYARLQVGFKRFDKITDEDNLREIITAHGIKAFQFNYSLSEEGRSLMYEVTIRSKRQNDFRDLARHLLELEDIQDFSITMAS